MTARRRRTELTFQTDQAILYALSRDTLRRGGGSLLSANGGAAWSMGDVPQELFARAISRPALLTIRERIA